MKAGLEKEAIRQLAMVVCAMGWVRVWYAGCISNDGAGSIDK